MATKEEMAQYKAGGVILVSLGLFLFLLFAAGNIMELFSTQKVYRVYVNSAKGLSVSDPVKYSGVKAGSVASVSIDPSRTKEKVLILLKVEGSYKIPKDSVAMIQPEGIMGNYSVNIIPGAQESFLKENGILAGQASTLLGSLTGGAGDFSSISSNLADTVRKINAIVDKNDEKITDIFNNLELFSKQLARFKTVEHLTGAAKSLQHFTDANSEKLASSLVSIDKGMQSLYKTLSNNNEAMKNSLISLKELTDTLQHTIKRNDDHLAETIENLSASTADISEILASNKEGLNRSFEKLNSALDSLDSALYKTNALIDDNRVHLYQSFYNLDVITGNVKILTDRLKADPSLLVFGSKDSGPKGEKEERQSMQAGYLELGVVGPYGKEDRH